MINNIEHRKRAWKNRMMEKKYVGGLHFVGRKLL